MTMPTEKTSSQLNLFVEQAEYLEPERFEQWTIGHPEEDSILRKLTQSGAKLLTGPRGCGKTTLLLKAYNRMLKADSSALPVYVNFKASLRLEPLYKVNANAVYWFNQWLLLKVYDGLHSTLAELKVTLSTPLRHSKQAIEAFAGQLELGQTTLAPGTSSEITVPELEEDIALVLQQIDRSRCVLLLDDAAHAFSPEQQRDFFDFFRGLKSRQISPKAAIYPGVTVYSSTFHVGHDAEEIDIWLKPHAVGYIPFMTSLLERRLPAEVFRAVTKDEALLKLLCYAAFGMPRALLNMVRTLYSEEEGKEPSISFSRTAVLQATKSVWENTFSLYSSLRLKLPMYSAFIMTGESILQRLINGIKSYNRGKGVDRQSVMAAIQRPSPAELSKVFGFLQYAGLVLPRGNVSRGEKGVFDLYIIHYAALIENNALLGRKAVSAAELVEAIEKRHPHEFTRFSPRLIVGDRAEEAFRLSLPPCQVCKTPRVNEAAKFCLNCGAQLKAVSIFETLVNQDISELPLTPARAQRIKDNSRIRTVKDVLMDHDNRELRSVPQVGPYWARRIFAYAEEFIA
jgi:ABC-type iron transport system FetAB ATPase subunit